MEIMLGADVEMWGCKKNNTLLLRGLQKVRGGRLTFYPISNLRTVPTPVYGTSVSEKE